MRNKKKFFTALATILVTIALLALLAHIVEEHCARQLSQTMDATDSTQTSGKDSVLPAKKVRLYGKKYIYNHQIETYLFLGTDGSGAEDGEGEDYVGSMADSINLLVLDKTDKTYAIIQLNRDTITEIDLMTEDGESYASAELQLCTAHWYGGNKQQSCENTVAAVSRFLGKIKIDGYLAIPMTQIGALNHLVGGVEVTIEDDFPELDPSLVMGETILLSDEQAVNYLRGRMNVGDGENTSRMRRQKQYMKSFAERAKQTLGNDADALLAAEQELLGFSTTDLTEKTLSGIADKLYQYENLGIFTPEGETALGSRLGDGLEHVEFYADEQSVTDMMTQLFHLEAAEEE